MRGAFVAAALVVLLALIVGVFKGFSFRTKAGEAPTAVVTRLGIPAEYKGHRLVLEGVETAAAGLLDLRHRVRLEVDGREIVLDPGYELDGLHPERFGFYLPDGRKLRLKKASADLSRLEWAEAAD